MFIQEINVERTLKLVGFPREINNKTNTPPHINFTLPSFSS